MEIVSSCVHTKQSVWKIVLIMCLKCVYSITWGKQFCERWLWLMLPINASHIDHGTNPSSFLTLYLICWKRWNVSQANRWRQEHSHSSSYLKIRNSYSSFLMLLFKTTTELRITRSCCTTSANIRLQALCNGTIHIHRSTFYFNFRSCPSTCTHTRNTRTRDWARCSLHSALLGRRLRWTHCSPDTGYRLHVGGSDLYWSPIR